MSDFAVVAIAKNENKFIDEWINFHLAIGFEHIYLYDNAGAADENLDAVAERYSDSVTVIKMPGPGRQSAAYRHFSENFRASVKWVAFIDIDEFIVFHKHRNVAGFISEYGYLKSIALSWKMFGHANHEKRPAGLVMDNYLWRYPFSFPQVKTICSTTEIDIISSIHNVNGKARLITGYDLGGSDKIPLTDDAGYSSELDTTSIVSIHHYFSRSLEDIQIKISRGSAAGTLNRNFDWYLNNYFGI